MLDQNLDKRAPYIRWLKGKQPERSERRAIGIETSEISISFPSNGESLRLKAMEFKSGSKTIVYGPSGRGKTTLLHVLAGLLPPNRGQVLLDSANLYGLTERERSQFRRDNIGVIFQTLNLLDHLTARENVSLALRTKGNLAAEQALREVAMLEYIDADIARLSLGQRQRIAVARILAQKPSLILADEPTSSLDDEHAEVVMRALWRAGENATLIMVSHDRRFRDRFEKAFSISEVLLS